MFLELLTRIADASLSFALLSFAPAFLVRTLELRDLLFGERSLELFLQLGE